MQNNYNLRVYRLWAPLYDTIFRPLFAAARRQAVALLQVAPGEKLLIPGVGTGLDLPLIPPGVVVVATDLSPAMLAKASSKITNQSSQLSLMDAQALTFPDESFDAILLTLILSVVPEGSLAFREAWRTLKPGGRLVIFDKFLPEASRVTLPRKLLGRLISALGTDPNRRLSDIISGIQNLKIAQNEANLLQGQYRLVLLRKEK